MTVKRMISHEWSINLIGVCLKYIWVKYTPPDAIQPLQIAKCYSKACFLNGVEDECLVVKITGAERPPAEVKVKFSSTGVNLTLSGCSFKLQPDQKWLRQWKFSAVGGSVWYSLVRVAAGVWSMRREHECTVLVGWIFYKQHLAGTVVTLCYWLLTKCVCVCSSKRLWCISKEWT